MESSFFDKVYDVSRKIPKGRVTSYGAIARYLGAARSARMVGWAMNKSGHLEPKVPAHRVVNRNGLLSGKKHFGDIYAMDSMLKAEGVVVKNNQVQNFDEVFWDPNLELSVK